MDKQQLLNSELLQVKAPNGDVFMCGSQNWFEDSWKKMSGCGPTTASGILWYLARSSQSNALCKADGAKKSDFLNLMNIMFDYVTPGKMGVNSTAIFVDGIVKYGNSCGIKLQTRTLDIPLALLKRPSRETLRDFILESLKSDSPLAFLNLSNGSLTSLDNWHWVIIIALEKDSMVTTICDQGATKDIDIGEWLKTTLLGGGFVSINNLAGG